MPSSEPVDRHYTELATERQAKLYAVFSNRLADA